MTELFGFLLIIFIGSNMYFRTNKHRIFTRQIFFKERIHKIVYFLFIQIQMIHTILFVVSC